MITAVGSENPTPVLEQMSSIVLKSQAGGPTLPELTTGDKPSVVKTVWGRREDGLTSRTDERSGNKRPQRVSGSVTTVIKTVESDIF